ncbi:hypothetical protein BD779DRAFT_1477130 [Infundibulicybe gibba]|nr:hypothetical protein BD779DRAFT_1477130 [Infundibulicybe gibba]
MPQEPTLTWVISCRCRRAPWSCCTTVALLGEVAPPPAGSILKAIGGSAAVIVGMIQQHVKNKKDVKSLISDIEKSISMICAEAEFLSPLTSPRFHDTMNEFQS